MHGWSVNGRLPGLVIYSTRNYGPGRVVGTPTKLKAGQPIGTGLSEKAKAGGLRVVRVNRRFGWSATPIRPLSGILRCRANGARLMGTGRTGGLD